MGEYLRRSMALTLAALLLVACTTSGTKDRNVPKESEYPVAHPRDVADRLIAYSKDLLNGLRPGLKLNNAKVAPLPCGDEKEAEAVPGRNLNHETWWPAQSPYTELIDTFVELPADTAIQPTLVSLRDYFASKGWRIDEFTSETATQAGALKAQAPEEGYGVRVDGISSADGRTPRIGVTFSSPCLRHPDVR